MLLNPFPIQFLSVLAYLLLRVIVGIVLIKLGLRHVRHYEQFSAISTARIASHSFTFGGLIVFSELIAGTLFILGLYTQIAALITVLLVMIMIFFRRRTASPFFPEPLFVFLLSGVALSLFITGGGPFGFDLPI